MKLFTDLLLDSSQYPKLFLELLTQDNILKLQDTYGLLIIVQLSGNIHFAKEHQPTLKKCAVTV